MKTILIAAVLLLTGCAQNPAPKPPVPGTPPHGVIKMMADKELVSWADLRALSTYQGKPQMRRFYIINNYAKPPLMVEHPPLYIASSRAVNVIDCQTKQRAVLQRLMFSEPFASGELMNRAIEPGQWESYDPRSLIGMIAGMACQIPVSHLKPEPPEDPRPARFNFG